MSKIFGIFASVLVFGVALFLTASALGWCGEAAQVAHDEFGPKAALKKYEWFIDQSHAIAKMDQDVRLYADRLKAVDREFAPYGADRSRWAPDVRMQYEHERADDRDDLVSIISQRNNLVREYDAASDKFDWAPFKTRGDLPPPRYDAHPLP